jgi:hypothetical protein
MKSTGGILIVVSVIIMAIIFIIPSSKEFSDTINFDIMFNKLFGMLFSVGLFISGAIFTAIGTVIEKQFPEKIHQKETGDGDKWCIECGKLISKSDIKCGHCGAHNY